MRLSKFTLFDSSPNSPNHLSRARAVWSKATDLSTRQAVLSDSSSIGKINSHKGDFSIDGGLSYIWYTVLVSGSTLRPRALLRDSSLLQSNQITASIPLGIKVFGGLTFSDGLTNRFAYYYSVSRYVGCKSSGIWYPDNAFSSNTAYNELAGKSIKIHPLFSTILIFSKAISVSAISWFTFSMVLFFFFFASGCYIYSSSSFNSASFFVSSNSRRASVKISPFRVSLSL